MGGQTGPVFYIYYEGMRHPPPILTRKKEFDLSKRKHGPTIVPALSAKVDNKEKRFIRDAVKEVEEAVTRVAV